MGCALQGSGAVVLLGGVVGCQFLNQSVRVSQLLARGPAPVLFIHKGRR